MIKIINNKNENSREILRVAKIECALWAEAQLNELKVSEDKHLTQVCHQMREV